MTPQTPVFQMALSFAGEDRAYVSEVAKALTERNILVFYDEYYKIDSLGKDLVVYFREIYSKSEYCIVFISHNYMKKSWTSKIELPSILSKSLISNNDYLVPVILDDSEIPGIPKTIGYIDARVNSPKQVASILIEKLNINNKFTDEQGLFELLRKDNLFIKRFICEFIESVQSHHVRYDLGSAKRRFYERRDFGATLERYGLGGISTNLGEELDIYLDLHLSNKGERLRKEVLENIPLAEQKEIAKEGWYHE